MLGVIVGLTLPLAIHGDSLPSPAEYEYMLLKAPSCVQWYYD